MPDEDLQALIAALQRRPVDPAAGEALARAILPIVRRAAQRTAAGRVEIDDVVQEALIRIVANVSRYDPAAGGAESWIWTITRRVGIDLARRDRRQERADEIAPSDPGDDALATALGRIADAALIARVYERLRLERDVAARRVLAAARDLAYLGENLSVAAIARWAELDESTARRALARVRRVTGDLQEM